MSTLPIGGLPIIMVASVHRIPSTTEPPEVVGPWRCSAKLVRPSTSGVPRSGGVWGLAPGLRDVGGHRRDLRGGRRSTSLLPKRDAPTLAGPFCPQLPRPGSQGPAHYTTATFRAIFTHATAGERPRRVGEKTRKTSTPGSPHSGPSWEPPLPSARLHHLPTATIGARPSPPTP